MYGATGAIVLTDVDVPSFDNIDLPFKRFWSAVEYLSVQALLNLRAFNGSGLIIQIPIETCDRSGSNSPVDLAS